MGVALDVHEFGELDGARFGDDADIVASKIDKHRVFGDFLGISEQVALHCLVFVGGAPAPAGACQWAVGDDQAIVVGVLADAAEDFWA